MASEKFRDYLRQTLQKRIDANSRYSLRAFASQLEIDPSTLSKILNGKRILGPSAMVNLGTRLGLSSERISKFVEANPSEASPFRRLDLDQFSVVADWFHFAILELMRVKDFQQDQEWIAKTFGLTTGQVSAGIERLQKVGLLKINSKGKWIDTSSGFTSTITKGRTGTAQKRLQSQLLRMSNSSLKHPLDARDHTSVTLAVDRSKLPEARELIREFRRNITRLLCRPTSCDAVYAVQVSLFPLTQSITTHSRKGEEK